MEERETKTPKFCRKCGKPLDPGALFCASCGVAVNLKTQEIKPVTSADVPDAGDENVNLDTQQTEYVEDTDVPNDNRKNVSLGTLDIGHVADADVSDANQENADQNKQSYEEYGYKFFYGVGKDRANDQQAKHMEENTNDDSIQKETVSNGGYKCLKCNCEMEEGMKFCPQCGASVMEASKESHEKKTCRMCGKEVKGTEKFCPYCGNQYTLAMPERNRNNNISSVVNDVPENGGRTGVASLVLGIISIVIAIFNVFTLRWLGTIMGIIGIILGANDRKNSPEENGTATAGWVCSIIGTVLNLLFYLACAACVGAIASL